MSYYDNQQWPAAAAQPSWEQPTPPARSGASSAVPREDSTAFSSQLEEVDRAVENLFKSGKIFNAPARRESLPMGAAGRGAYPEFDPRMGGGPSRQPSGSEFGGDARTYSASNLQNFYATQRHQPSRASEAEQVMQAKRRMAAQRERELRNYHQEQQYNRNVLAETTTFGGKPADRTMSPGSGMSEEERRELIARQRSALYGEGAAYPEGSFVDENGNTRPGTQGSSAQLSGGRGHSPLAFENGGASDSQQGSAQSQGQQRSRANSTSSPSSNPTNFSVFDAQQSSRTSTSSPGGSPPRQGGKAGAPGPNSAVAPIGTRPNAGQGQAPNPALNKRSTTPLPSPLSYGFAAGSDEQQQNNGNGGDRATSAASNPTSGAPAAQDVGLGWGSKSGVWGKNSLGVQASVWG